ncbi:fusion protein [Mossman virus]|uniref:Fusion glycoprotein F0 n=1 Tax=Mossman virus TaxID=241630 RepID=Q6WGM1_9MONO|nr:fusion protein [Mossman virus]AAQ23991.1 fusion protein [Mossman virus]
MSNYFPARVIIIVSLITAVSCQISFQNLSTIGVFKFKEYDYRVSGDYNEQFLAIKMVPNVTGVENCTASLIDEYRHVIYNLLQPINTTLTASTSNVDPYAGNKKFFGAVIAGVALGVATAAQVTAGVALYEARQNAAAIAEIKESLHYTHKAIESLQISQKQTVVAIQGIQDQINTNIIPQINALTCEIANQRLRLMLLQYYTEMLSSFGPIIQDPLSGHITVQALSQAAGGNITGLMRELGYSSKDLRYILSVNGISANIIDADPEIGSIILRIRYPSMIKIPDVAVMELSYLAYHAAGGDWLTVGPRFILKRGYSLSNLDITSCTIGEDFLLCSKDVSSPMSLATQSCLRGDTQMCSRTAVQDREAPRFLLLQGNLIVNCMSVNCKCEDPEETITQDPAYPLMVLGSDTCKIHYIDGIRIKLGKVQLPPITVLNTLSLGPIVVLNPIDVSNQLSLVETTVKESEDHLKNAIGALRSQSRVGGVGIVAIVGLIIATVSLVVLVISGCCLVKYFSRTATLESSLTTIEHGPTLAPKSGPIIPTYINPVYRHD